MSVRALPAHWSRLPRDVRDRVLKTLIERRHEKGDAQLLHLRKADRSGLLPASLEQTVFLRQYERFGGRVAWTMAAPPIILEKVDDARIRQAITKLAHRHDVLHATFRKTENRFFLHLDKTSPVPFTISKMPLTIALTGAENWVRRRYDAMLAEPFNPETGPLWRAELCSFAGRGVILLTFCSAIVDGESLYLIDQDLRSLLATVHDEGGPTQAFDYADYALTQDDMLRSGRFDDTRNWWRTQLAGGPPARWADGRDAIASSHLSEQVIGAKTGRALDAYAAQHRTTAPVVLLTQFMALVRELDGGDDLWVSSAMATRDIPGTETMIGTFARQALLRYQWPENGNPLRGIHDLMARTMERPPVPHLLIRDDLEKAYPQAPSAFRYVFNYRLVAPSADTLEDDHDVAYRAGPKTDEAAREEDILLLIMQSGERRLIHWYLRSDRFSKAQAEHLLTGFHTALMRTLQTDTDPYPQG
jgi:Condensation domain